MPKTTFTVYDNAYFYEVILQGNTIVRIIRSSNDSPINEDVGFHDLPFFTQELILNAINEQ